MGFFDKVRPSHFGLMFVHMWIYCITHRSCTAQDVPIMTCLYLTQTIVLAVIVIYSFKHVIGRDSARAIDLIAAACMAAAAIIVCLPVSIEPGALVVGSCIGALGVSWAYARWAQVYTRFDIHYAAPLIFLTMAFGSAGKVIIDILPDPYAAFVLVIIPAAAFGTCSFAARSVPEAPKPVLLYNPRTVTSLWRLIVGVAVYSLAVGVIQSVMLEKVPPSDTVSILVHHGSEVILGLGLFLWVVPLRGGLSFSRSWRLVVLLMTTALVFLPYIDESWLEYLLSLVRTAQTFLIVLLFLTLTDIARHSTYHSLTVFAAGWAFYTLPFAIGTILGHSLQATTAETVIAAAIVWAIVLAAIFLLDENAVGRTLVFSDLNREEDDDVDSEAARVGAAQSQLDSPETGTASAGGALAVRCAALAKEAGLTLREAEILELLARGRSKAYIADAFIISENTVRTHVKHLYAKLDVHTRQELLDCVEAVKTDQTAASHQSK